MQRFLDELEINESQLVGKEYKIEIIKTFEDSILGIFRIQNEAYGFNFNCNTKVLIVGEEEKDIQWLKDIIKCYGLNWEGRYKLAKEGLYHDILINDKDSVVRKGVAEKTTNENYLKILARDEDWGVCYWIAKRGFHDIFINDKDWVIRKIIAETTNNKKYLEKLSIDEDEGVREIALERLELFK